MADEHATSVTSRQMRDEYDPMGWAARLIRTARHVSNVLNDPTMVAEYDAWLELYDSDE